MNKSIYLLTILLLTASCGGKGKKADSSANENITPKGIEYPFTIDTSKDYPLKPVSFQELFGELEYVKLETRSECYISHLLRDITVTDDYIFLIEGGTNFMRFDRNGKFLNRIGDEGRGPGEFLTITAYCINEEAKEVYIRDGLTKTITILDFDGKYKRHFRLPQYRTVDMDLLNDSTLIISNGTDGNHDYDPYQFVSLADGKITGTPIERFDNPVPIINYDLFPKNSYTYDQMMFISRLNEGKVWQVSFGDDENIFSGNEKRLISNMASDTVFVLSNDGKASPHYIKLPSNKGVQPDMRTYFRLQFETPSHAIFTYQIPGESFKAINLNKTNGDITTTWLYNNDIDTENTFKNRITTTTSGKRVIFCHPYQAIDLINWHAEGKLSGELEKIVSTMTENDNPVLMIQKKDTF